MTPLHEPRPTPEVCPECHGTGVVSEDGFPMQCICRSFTPPPEPPTPEGVDLDAFDKLARSTRCPCGSGKVTRYFTGAMCRECGLWFDDEHTTHPAGEP